MAGKQKESGDSRPGETPRRGPLGDVLPTDNRDPRTPGGQPPEKVEDRPTVGSVKPEDYPVEDRNKGN